MLPEFLHNLRNIAFTIRRTFAKRNIILPGGEMSSYSRKNSKINIHQYSKPFFSIRYALISMIRKGSFSVREKEKGIRLEAVLTGELVDQVNNESPETIHSGEYRLSDNKELLLLFQKKSACTYFITRYSDEMLDEIGIKDIVRPCDPRFLSPRMTKLIQDILRPPFDGTLREFYYDNCVRELLFLHFTDSQTTLPGQLTDEDLSVILHADNLLQQNLKIHDAIPELADKVGTNEFKLKRGFQAVFSMGVFERLTFHRMQFARTLLTTTQRTIDDIADDVGYSSRSNFITAFRKIHKITPKKWRLSNAGKQK